MDKSINIGIMLTAIDRASAVVASSVSKSIVSLQKLNAYTRQMANFGPKAMAAGAVATAPVIAAANVYADQEKAYLKMKTSLMSDGARVDQKQLAALDAYASKSIEAYGYSKQANLEMITTFLNNGATAQQILGGMGQAVQQLGVAFDIPASEAAQFAARMARDMDIAAKKMPAFMDQINRLHMIGVGKTGSEAVTEMSEAFSKAGLAASVLGPKAQGLQAAKDLGATMAIFIKRGFSGSVVGTDFYKLLMGSTNADKMKKVNQALFAANGQQLNFFDQKGQFAGYAQMVGELNKLKGLTISQISGVLKPFANKSGPIAGILASLSESGTQGFNENQMAMSKKATLAAITKEIMSGLAKQEEITKNLALAAAGDIGKTYGKELKEFLHSMNAAIAVVRNFTENHKTLTKVIALSLGGFGALAFFGGSISLGFAGIAKFGSIAAGVLGFAGRMALFAGRGLLYAGAYLGRLALLFLTRGIPAMASFTAQVWANAAAWLANPATYIILAIVAAVAALIAIGVVVYKNWDAILSWFEKKWVLLKASVAGMISVFGLFLDVIVGVGKALVGAFTFNPSMIVEGAKQAATAVSKIANGGIKTAFLSGANESLHNSNARINKDGEVELDVNKIKPKAAIVNHNHQTTMNLHFHGVNPNDHAATGKQFAGVLDKWYKDKKANERRVAYK